MFNAQINKILEYIYIYTFDTCKNSLAKRKAASQNFLGNIKVLCNSIKQFSFQQSD